MVVHINLAAFVADEPAMIGLASLRRVEADHGSTMTTPRWLRVEKRLKFVGNIVPKALNTSKALVRLANTFGKDLVATLLMAHKLAGYSN